ncbi:MAG: phosphoesterase [Lachnospiraceae bacterium]
MKSDFYKLKRFKGIAIFFIVYILLFFFLEQRQTDFHIINCSFDAWIPFCEYFIVPYVLWYLFVGGTVLYLGLFQEDSSEYFRLIHILMLGMAAFLAISLLYPNALRLRPQLEGDSIFIRMVEILYRVDTPTNVLPSLHVYNTVACQMAILRNRPCRSNRWITAGTCTLSVLIILSTMFLKQHSIVDVTAALLLYPIVELCFTPAQMKDVKIKAPAKPAMRRKNYKRPPVI